jgi:hypothetical protein
MASAAVEDVDEQRKSARERRACATGHADGSHSPILAIRASQANESTTAAAAIGDPTDRSPGARINAAYQHRSAPCFANSGTWTVHRSDCDAAPLSFK